MVERRGKRCWIKGVYGKIRRRGSEQRLVVVVVVDHDVMDKVSSIVLMLQNVPSKR
jgi:hypothetical protein